MSRSYCLTRVALLTPSKLKKIQNVSQAAGTGELGQDKTELARESFGEYARESLDVMGDGELVN